MRLENADYNNEFFLVVLANIVASPSVALGVNTNHQTYYALSFRAADQGFYGQAIFGQVHSESYGSVACR